jgi:hypothetical protein
MTNLAALERAEYELIDTLARIKMAKSQHLGVHKDVLRKGLTIVDPSSVLVNAHEVQQLVVEARSRRGEELRLEKAARPTEALILELLKPSNLGPSAHPAFMGWR